MSAASGPPIVVEHVSKRFVLQRERIGSFQELFMAMIRRGSGPEEFWALRDVSFTAERGEALAIMGPNGSGKSTLLKLITRILVPTTGRVQINGRVSALLELGAGFHPDLTGRENVYLYGSLLGFTKRQMDTHLAEIIEFSGVDQFIDMPLRHYSSGMEMRLGFAVATSVDPDILITDEVLAVGDAAFQQKCRDKMMEFKRKGKTILLVSHNVRDVEWLCDRAVLLRKGEMAAVGPTAEVVAEYGQRKAG